MNIELIITKITTTINSGVEKYHGDFIAYLTALGVYLNLSDEIIHSSFVIFTAVGSYCAVTFTKWVIKKVFGKEKKEDNNDKEEEQI